MSEDEKKGGRPLGSTNRRLTQQAISLAQESGLLLPHEILLRVANGRAIKVDRVDGIGRVHTEIVFFGPEAMVDAAKAAAPYYAPKLSNVGVIQGVSDEELDAIIAGAAAEAEISLGTDGEGEEGEDEEGAQSSVPARPRKRFKY